MFGDRNMEKAVFNLKFVRKTVFFLFMLVFLSIIGTIGLFPQVPSYQVRVTGIRFLYGIGRGPTSSPPDYISTNYYRGYDQPGTMIELTAEMYVGSSWVSMYGPVSFRVNYSNGSNSGTFDVLVPNGSKTATLAVPYNDTTGFLSSWIPTGETQRWTYSAVSASGTYVSSLASSASESVYWDNKSPPSLAAVTPYNVNVTTTSITLTIDPVNTSSPPNQDFYEYRVYYREGGTQPFVLWNGKNDPTLRGLENNPYPVSESTELHFDSTGRKYTTIPNLKLYTQYDYYVTIADVFGNESPAPGTPFVLRTQPFSIDVTLSDGITSYDDFTDLSNPALRTLRESNIRVEMHLISSTYQPENVRVWFTTGNGGDIVSSTFSINSAEFRPANPSGEELSSSYAVNIGPNIWEAYLPTTTSVIKNGNIVKFIVETSLSGITTYSDKNLADGDPNNNPWNFYVGKPVKFKPWPARVLNNVIDNKNPLAYPSYYLTDDAYVTIKIYDVTGSPVCVLLDGVFRRGGQNIKENGWDGSNKSGNKVGIGLYYVHFYAKKAKGGSVILNCYQKITMAK